VPITNDIAASYRRPGQVLRAHFARGHSEPRALAWVMGACGVMFMASWPRLARESHLQGTDLQPALGGALLATLIFMPLILYVIAGLCQLVARMMGSGMTGFGARVALFWALLAASPLALLNGLVAGFIGDGGAQLLVGLAWCAAFMWFWVTGLRTAHRDAKSEAAA
jgi:hypothetical protein